MHAFAGIQLQVTVIRMTRGEGGGLGGIDPTSRFEEEHLVPSYTHLGGRPPGTQ